MDDQLSPIDSRTAPDAFGEQPSWVPPAGTASWRSDARTTVGPVPGVLPTAGPEQALMIAVLERPAGTASGHTEAWADSTCSTTYDDESSVCVRRADTDSRALAALAAELLPEGIPLPGILRIDGRLVPAQERRTDQWVASAAAWRGLAVVTRTPARAPGLPQVRLTVVTHKPTGESS
ncbi:hypothetical protein [Kitasatospora sp. NPDC058046]|uniref:hypothetical protein n=1 Tax=Kitasatospora sp. NPDC058046 TaxID=3346312 RepID=UPI0036DE863C